VYVEWWYWIWVPVALVGAGVRMWLQFRSLNQPATFAPMPLPGPGYPPLPYQPAPAAPTQIKQTPCRHCGAVKVQPPSTACLYCDFCGTMVDWDLRMAQGIGFLTPMKELSRLMFNEKVPLEHARAHGDRETYRQTMMRVWNQHMAMCPLTYSPRIGDPSYRQALIYYLGMADTEVGFDAECQALEEQVANLRQQLPRQPGQPVNPHTLHQLVNAKKASLERALALIGPHLHLHPDASTVELARSVMASTFVQYWLPFLTPDTQQWLIDEMGLGGDYAPIQPVPTTERHCGHCGGDIMCAHGASRILCEKCGFFNDVGKAEIACPQCGGSASPPAGTHSFSCPYCKADLRIS